MWTMKKVQNYCNCPFCREAQAAKDQGEVFYKKWLKKKGIKIQNG